MHNEASAPLVPLAFGVHMHTKVTVLGLCVSQSVCLSVCLSVPKFSATLRRKAAK